MLHSYWAGDTAGRGAQKLTTWPDLDLNSRNSRAVQWLGLGAFTARAQVQSLVQELRSGRPLGAAKRKKKKKNWLLIFI